MCGRMSLASSPDEVRAEFGLAALPPDYRPRYNIAPSQPVLSILADGGPPAPAFLKWGLVPFWAKEAAIGNRMINARAETAPEKPAFRAAFARRRCLIPVDGFYEWQKRGRHKAPMRIRLVSRRPFALAGLWEVWRKGDGPPLRTVTVLTTTCCEALRAIHDRMPVIVPREAQQRWLGEDGADALRDLLVPYEGTDLEAYEVSTLVNNPANDVPECLEAL